MDVSDKEEEVVVVAELPSVEKEDINLQASERRITTSMDTPQRKYHRELPLPEEVDPKPVKASYKNSFLEYNSKRRPKKKRSAFSN